MIQHLTPETISLEKLREMTNALWEARDISDALNWNTDSLAMLLYKFRTLLAKRETQRLVEWSE
jgi:hypothetical protein